MNIKFNYVLSCILTVTALHGDEIFVTSAADSGTGTLRQALLTAPPGASIVFDQSLSGQTISLSSNLPAINEQLTIKGPTAGNVTLNGNNSFRLFNILSGSVAISHVDLSNPDQSSPGGTLSVGSSAITSIADLSIMTSNQCIFLSPNAQIKTSNIAFSEPSDAGSSAFMFSPGSEFILRVDPAPLIDVLTQVAAPGASTTPIPVEGSGNITKVGDGTTTLLPTTPSVGLAMSVREGTLIFTGVTTEPILVSSGATLKGSNTCLYLSNRGTVKTGQSIGTSVIVGDLNQTAGGTLEAEIAPSGASDLYAVGSNANLAGNLFVLAESGVYFKGNTFTFLTTGGAVNGVFDATSSNSGGLAYRINYFPTSIQIEILQNLLSFDGVRLSGNAAQVYPVLANANVTPGSDLANVIIALNALGPPPALENALNELQPSALGGLNWNGASMLHHINSLVLQQRGSFCGRNCLKKPTRPCCPSLKNNGLWASGIGERLRQGTIDGLRGFKTARSGGLMGYDRALSEKTTLGIAGGYTDGHLSWNEEGGKTNTQEYTAALYSAFCLGRLQIDVSGVGSYYTHDVKRKIDFPGINRDAKSSPNGHAVMGHVGAGCLFVRNYFKVSPFINGEYFHTHTSSLKEHGAQSLDLRVKKFSTNFVRAQAGIAIGEEFCTSWGIFSPALSLSYVYFSPHSNTHIKAKFASIPQEFTAKTTGHAFHEIAPAASLSFSAGNNVWISASYEGEFAKKRQDQAISLNLRVQF